jgi:hypothetical protein
MTNPRDVIRQLETALTDCQIPPTTHEREVFYRVLFTLYASTAAAKGSW